MNMEMSSSSSEQQQQQQEEAAEQISGNVNVPKTGISINDEMTEMQNTEKFLMKLFPLEKNGNGAAAIQTVTRDTASDEPMRYLVPLGVYEESNGANADANKDEMDVSDEGDDRKEDDNEHNLNENSNTMKQFAMVDVPCFSQDLVAQMKSFMGTGSTLSHILITCRNGIHYDEAPAVYVTRKSDLRSWKKAFPAAKVIMYRLDTPRDCKPLITQMLDGYGPWALNNGDAESESEVGLFQETGRPLTVLEWDEDVQASVLDDGEMPPDDQEDGEDDADAALYTPQAIKERELNKEILAIYTPGHTYGSVSYIFPQSKICCSGFTIPVEDVRADASAAGIPRGAGPKLDYSGYLTTNTGGLDRQVESARHLASVYNDRFEVVLPSRGPPVSLGGYTAEGRSRILHDMLNEFAKLGQVYESLGIL